MSLEPAIPPRFRPRTVFRFALLLLFAASVAGQSPERARPPETRVETVVEVLHGVEVPDPYRWLEDQQAPEVRAWIDAQNAYTRSRLDTIPGRKELAELVGGLLRVDTVGTPTERNGLYFFTKRAADQALPILYLRRGINGKDEVLLDPHPMSPDGSVSISTMAISDDGALLAYGVRTGGEDEVELRILDVKTRRDLPDRLPRARYGSFSFLRDNSGFFYMRFDREGGRIRFHKLGTEIAADTVVFGEGLSREKLVSTGLSESGRWQVFVISYGSAASKTEVYLRDLAAGGPIVPVVADIEARFVPQFAGERLLLVTNWQAPNNRVLEVDPENPARENWRELVAEREHVLQGFSGVGGKFFARYVENVIPRVYILDARGKPAGELQVPGIGVVSEMSGRWKSKEGFFSFSAFNLPPTTYRYEIASGKQTVWSKLEVPLRSEEFEVQQVWYTSKDGTRVPMFLFHRKGIKLDGSNPTRLHAYGGFNISQLPNYSGAAAAWAQMGGVYALANLRGGGEFGEAWHRAGMLEKKQNVFDDFIAAAEWLIANKYTRPEKLSISGGSNGGLLVGAAMTQRPDLFRAVLCSYPLLDMVRYHRFLVARFWVPEYGSAEDPEQFRYLHAYSPYHNVREGVEYPAVMFISGDSDTRVDPLHARKMAALVQARTGSDRPVLLHYDTKAGHIGGVAPVAVQIEQLVDQLSFLAWQLEMDWPPKRN
jgi:prolyl oligopeptidase